MIKCQFCSCVLQRNVESPEWGVHAHPLVVRNTRDITKAMHLCASIICPQEHADEDPLVHKVYKVLALLCEQGEDQKAAVEVGAAGFLQAYFNGGKDGEMEKKDEGGVHMIEEDSEEEEERRSRPMSRLSSRASSGSSSSSSSGSRSPPRTRSPPALQACSPLPLAPSPPPPTPPSPPTVSVLLTEQKVIIRL